MLKGSLKTCHAECWGKLILGKLTHTVTVTVSLERNQVWSHRNNFSNSRAGKKRRPNPPGMANDKKGGDPQETAFKWQRMCSLLQKRSWSASISLQRLTYHIYSKDFVSWLFGTGTMVKVWLAINILWSVLNSFQTPQNVSGTFTAWYSTKV